MFTNSGHHINRDTFDPVTLSPDWSKVPRLLLLTGMSVVGSIGNVFMISAVMIEDHLKKRGNSFLVNIALVDQVITCIVYPASTIVILANVKESNTICNLQYFLALLTCHVTVLTLFIIAIENYARLCMSPDCYRFFTPTKITVTIFIIWTVSAAAAGVQFAFNLCPDYCHKTSSAPLPYQITISTIFIFIPAISTCFCFLLIIFKVRTFRSIHSFRPPIEFTVDYDVAKVNFLSYICFVLFWLPFVLVLWALYIQTISESLFYNLAWLALSKSCFNNFIYCIVNKHFRNAYMNLFHYCCCKSSVSFSRRPRDPVRTMGDVRVHIIPGYNMYSYTSPQRSSTNRSSTTRQNGREVYEL